MAAYGKGQMLGSGINPESFKLDFSGFADAAKMQAQGLSNLGQSIGGAIQDYGEVKKEQKKVDAYNKASAKSIEAAITLGKSYEIKGVEKTLSPFLESYNDPNLSPIEKAALLDEGKAMIPNVFGRFDKNQAMLIDQLAAQNRGSGATPSLQRVTRKEVINGQVYDVPTIFNPQTGVTTYEDGTVISNPLGAAGQINSALNFSTVGGDVAGAAINTTGEDAPSLLPMPPQTDVAGIQAAIAMPDSNASLANVNPMPPGTPMMTTMPRIDGVPPMPSRPEPQAAVTPPPVGRQPSRIPPGAVPVKPEEPITTSRIVTGQEAEQLGGDPNKKYIIKEVGKSVTDMALVPPDITPAEERAIQEIKDKETETKRAGEVTVKSINKFIDKEGNYNKDLDRAVGFFEEAATGIAKVTPFFGTQSPKDRANQKELAILVEKGLLDAASELKPVSNVDLQLLKANRPQVTDPPELWAGWLKDVRDILDDPNSYTESGNNSDTEKPQSATDRFRAKAKQ